MLTKKITKSRTTLKLSGSKKGVVKTAPKMASTAKLKRLNAGPRLSDAVIHGNTVYVAGKVAVKTKGKSVALQTKEILESIDKTLKEAGTDKSKLITANIWLAKYTTAPEMNAVWEKWVSKGNTPARATVEAKLLDPACTVEIMVTAAL